MTKKRYSFVCLQPSQRRLLFIGLAIAAVVVVRMSVSVWAQPVWTPPADRGYPWNPGIPGGIPNRTTVCATVAPPSGNAASAIQSALNACPQDQVVQLTAGTFAVNSTVFVPTGRTLRGAGQGQTIIAPSNTGSLQTSPLAIGLLWGKTVSSRDLTADAPRGATSVTLNDASGLTVGEIILIDQVTDPNLTTWGSNCTSVNDDCRIWFTRRDRPIGDMLEITGISGNVVSFATPLAIAFRVSSQAQIARFADNAGTVRPLPRYAGIENLTVTSPTNSRGGVAMTSAAYSWVKNVEVRNTEGDNVGMFGCYRCVLRDSYLHSTSNPNPGGAGYGNRVDSYVSRTSLIENNVSRDSTRSWSCGLRGRGNVVGYNYMEDGYVGDYPSMVEVGLNAPTWPARTTSCSRATRRSTTTATTPGATPSTSRGSATIAWASGGRSLRSTSATAATRAPWA